MIKDTRLMLSVAALLSRSVGSAAAIECANAAVGAMVGGISLEVATAEAIHFRRTQPHYASEWGGVSTEQATMLVASVHELIKKRGA